MILSKKQAKKLKMPMTIDLKKQAAEEYLYLQKNTMEKIIHNNRSILKMISIVWIILYIFIILSWGVNIFPKAHASSNLAWNQDTSITYDKLVTHSGMKPPREIYLGLKKECYEQGARDKLHCIKTGLSIAWAECSWKDYKTPFGLQSAEKWYKKWVRSYNLYWYKSQWGFFFYWDWGQLGRSHYCTSEESSWSSLGCPNWRKNFNQAWNSLRIK